jgi:hypothetical protein
MILMVSGSARTRFDQSLAGVLPMARRNSKRILELPFSILIDTAEQQPFEFTNIRADADKKYRPYNIHTERVCLGRHPDSLGDYSLTGGIGHCHVERKGQGDAYGTFLGFSRRGPSSRYDRFKHELENLSKLDAAPGCGGMPPAAIAPRSSKDGNAITSRECTHDLSIAPRLATRLPRAVGVL